MDFLNYIKALSDEELEKVVIEKIKKLEEAKGNKKETIGYQLDYNPTNIPFVESLDEDVSFGFGVQCIYNGYIPKGTRMVYGFCYDYNGVVSNDGKYYDVDTDDYVLEFCKYIRDKEINSEYDLYDFLLEFIKNYFGYFDDIKRDEMFQMIYKGDRVFFDPYSEHKFSWFKGRGNGLCTEYGLIAQNILNLFDIETSIVIGKVKNDDGKGIMHAFNIISFEGEEKKDYLIDFAKCTFIYDMNFNIIDCSPFISEIEDCNEELIADFVDGKKHLIFDDYDYLLLGNDLMKLSDDSKRDYYIPNAILDNGVWREEVERIQFIKTI